MSDILKKAVNEIENIKKGVKKQLAKEIIAENKKEIDNKISKLLENEINATETPIENTDEKEFNVDFIDTILDDIDIESILIDTEGDIIKGNAPAPSNNMDNFLKQIIKKK